MEKKQGISIQLNTEKTSKAGLPHKEALPRKRVAAPHNKEESLPKAGATHHQIGAVYPNSRSVVPDKALPHHESEFRTIPPVEETFLSREEPHTPESADTTDRPFSNVSFIDSKQEVDYYSYTKQTDHHYFSSKQAKATPSLGFNLSMLRRTKVLAMIGFAVLVGLVFGIGILTVFSNLDTDEKLASEYSLGNQGNQSVPQGNNEQANLDSSNTDGAEESIASAPLIIPSGSVSENRLQLPSRAYYAVQAGAFSDKALAEERVERMRQLGRAAIVVGEEQPYRLYVGVTSTKEDALLIGQYFQQQGEEVYIREHVTKELPETTIQAQAEALQLFPTFLAKGDQLVQLLGQITSVGIIDPSYTLPPATWNQLQELHRSFLQEGTALFSIWDGEVRRNGEQLMNQVSNAMNALESYRGQNHPSYLWRVQQASLNYLSHYEALIHSL